MTSRSLRPALLVVDVTHAFVGDKPEPILDSIGRFPNSCGEAGWRAITHICGLLALCRDRGVPAFYTRGLDARSAVTRGAWSWKKAPEAERAVATNVLSNVIPEAVAPLPSDVVIAKTKPSAFFGTPLASYLVHLGVDTVVVTGTTTSGCIRATVLDAFSYGFHVLVVEEAVCDRTPIVHQINCADMDAHHADVIAFADAVRYLETLPLHAPH